MMTEKDLIIKMLKEKNEELKKKNRELEARNKKLEKQNKYYLNRLVNISELY